MKTTFKAKRGHVWHVVHETKTGMARSHAWVLCGQFYDVGERGGHQPTCPGCCKLDNPLTLSSEERAILQDAARIKGWRDAPTRSKAFQRLVQVDYVTADASLTRRGAILVEDFDLGPVPLADVGGLVHSRRPLARRPVCLGGLDPVLDGTEDMTTERYAKLRKVQDQVMVTCLQCLARGDHREDVYGP